MPPESDDTPPFPIYVRKLDRKAHWFCGVDLDPADVVTKCFREVSDARYSLYECEDHSCLDLVMAGLHMSRGVKSLEHIDYVYFTRSELELSGAILHTNPGETPCECCNSLHVDIQADFRGLVRLCNSTKDRLPNRYSKSKLNDSLSILKNFGCYGFDDRNSSDCLRKP